MWFGDAVPVVQMSLCYLPDHVLPCLALLFAVLVQNSQYYPQSWEQNRELTTEEVFDSIQPFNSPSFSLPGCIWEGSLGRWP